MPRRSGLFILVLCGCVGTAGDLDSVELAAPAEPPAEPFVAVAPSWLVAHSASGEPPAVDGGEPGDARTPSLCAGSGLLFCEDFEGAGLDSTIWSIEGYNSPGSTFETDPARAARGRRSLRVHLAAQGVGHYADATLFERKTFPALQNAMYGRLFFYLETTPPAHNLRLVEGFQAEPHQASYEENINIVAFYAVQYSTSPPIDEGFTSAKHIELNRWTCLEWYYSGTGETRTWVDGIELTDIHRTDFHPIAFQQLNLGMYEPEGNLIADAGYDAWYDEVALDSARIGCDR